MADIPGSAATRAVLPRGADFTTGELERGGDSDWYRVTLQKGVNYAFNADIELEPPLPDDGYVSLRFRLRDPSGRVLDEDTAETYDGYDAGFDYRATASGTYFLEVVGDKADYGLRAIADAAPDVRTTAEIEVGQTRDLSFFYSGDIDTYGATSSLAGPTTLRRKGATSPPRCSTPPAMWWRRRRAATRSRAFEHPRPAATSSVLRTTSALAARSTR